MPCRGERFKIRYVEVKWAVLYLPVRNLVRCLEYLNLILTASVFLSVHGPKIVVDYELIKANAGKQCDAAERAAPKKAGAAAVSLEEFFSVFF